MKSDPSFCFVTLKVKPFSREPLIGVEVYGEVILL